MTPLDHDPHLLEAVLLSALQTPCGVTGATARARSRTLQPLRALDSDVTVRHALRRYHREGWIRESDAGRFELTGLGEQRLLWHVQWKRVAP